MGALMRAKDWAATPLGPPEHWPQSLKTAVHILLTSRYAMWLGWGEDLTFFYNDAYRPTLGIKHPWALGSSTRVVWAEIWRDIGPRIETVLQTGEATYDEALLLLLERSGFAEETYHTFSYSPLADDTGKVAGMLCVVTEETKRTIGERRMALLRELASNLASANTQPEVFAAIERQVSGYRKDLPFTLLYLFDHDGSGRARLMSATGVRASHPSAPTVIEPETAAAPWPAHELWTDAAPTLVGDLTRWFATEPPTGEWDRPPAQVAVIPIKSQGQERPAGFLVAALNPYCRYGADYAGFIDLLAGQIAAGLANARAYEEERRRAEALTELDRAKTAFFSNISHEFRTPLTLMLGPLEETLAGPDGSISDLAREQLQMVHRNSLRLLKLVNDLLDFSRIEAGRVEAHYQPIDLAAYTAELTSVFRTAVERAGLQLVVDCAPLCEPVYVDCDMWEKIVLNLLSNALKYTFAGKISVSLIAGAKTVQLAVSDTGTGIPEHELPHLFERFHRVEGARGRTHEGSGIGLSLVAELVKLHGGTVEATSVLSQGSTFTVTVPTGTAHLPRERLGTPSAPVSPMPIAAPYIEDALHWLPPAVNAALPVLGPDHFFVVGTADRPQKARIVLADDNADIRDYVRRLLDTHYTVEAVADGVEALAAIDRALPDLVLTDVMMPRLDGFGLLAALRARPGGSDVPIILLSARAGESSRIEGLRSGADDYLVKPFAAQELLARVDANLALSRLRRHSAQVEREARAQAEQAQQQAEAANRTKDEFLAILGHELRTPLNPIIGWTQMLRRGKVPPDKLDKALEVIERNARLQTQLIDDLLDVSRIMRGSLTIHPRPITLSSVVGAATEAVRSLAEEKQLELVELLEAEVPLNADSTRMQQVVWNLLINAIKFTPSGGRIQIQLEHQDDRARLTVSDSGAGISPAFLPHMFERFRQADTRSTREQTGLGLGLYIVRSVVEAHGGQVWAESEGEGKGATFTVLLPVLTSAG